MTGWKQVCYIYYSGSSNRIAYYYKKKKGVNDNSETLRLERMEVSLTEISNMKKKIR